MFLPTGFSEGLPAPSSGHPGNRGQEGRPSRTGFSSLASESLAGQRGPGALWRKRHKALQVPPGLGLPADFSENTRHVPVGVGILGLLPQDALERSQGQVGLAKFRQHAAKTRPGPEVLGVKFDRRVIPLTGCRQIAGPVEQFRQHEGYFCCGALRLKHRPQSLSRLDVFAGGLEVISQVENLSHDVPAGERRSRPVVLRLPSLATKDEDLRFVVAFTTGVGGLSWRGDVGVEAQMHLAASTEKDAIAGNRKPPAINHELPLHAGCSGSSVGCQASELGIDLTE